MIVRYLRKKPKVVEELAPMGRHVNTNSDTIEKFGSIEQLYVKRKKKCRGEPTGVIVAFQDETGNVLVGYSLLNPTDVFSKEDGKMLAKQRAISCSENIIEEAKSGRIHAIYDTEPVWDHKKHEYVPRKNEFGAVNKLLKCNSQTKRIAQYILDTYEFAKRYYAKQENIHVSS